MNDPVAVVQCRTESGRFPGKAPRAHSAVLWISAGGQIGFGHLTRSLSVAQHLHTRYAWGVTFLLSGDDAGRIEERGFRRVRLPVEGTAPAVERHLDEAPADALICDLRDATGYESIARLRGRTSLIAMIDDVSERRLAADVVFYPPAPQVATLEWPASRAVEVNVGWPWVVIPSVAVSSTRSPSSSSHPRLLLSFGGSDVLGLSRRFARILAEMPDRYLVTLVLGPGVADPERVRADVVATLPSCTVVVDPPDLRSRIRQADLVVCTYGVTVFEAASEGRCCAFVNYGEDDVLSGRALVEAGLAVALGRHDDVDDAALAAQVSSLLVDHRRRLEIGERAARAIDGRGAERVAERIAALATREGQGRRAPRME